MFHAYGAVMSIEVTQHLAEILTRYGFAYLVTVGTMRGRMLWPSPPRWPTTYCLLQTWVAGVEPTSQLTRQSRWCGRPLIRVITP